MEKTNVLHNKQHQIGSDGHHLETNVNAEQEQTVAEMWYKFFKENGKVYRSLIVKIGGEEIWFPAEERVHLKHISEKSLERLNQDTWNERILSHPLPTMWMKTGL